MRDKMNQIKFLFFKDAKNEWQAEENARKKREKQLHTLLAFVQNMTKYDWQQENAFAVIKMLTDKMTLDSAFPVLVGEKQHENLYGNYITSYFMEIDEKRADALELRRNIQEHLIGKVNDLQVEISLAKDPVIPFPWHRDRLHHAVATIGSPAKAWVEHTNNHSLILLLPVGVCLVNAGNHSCFSGMLKREGTILIKPDSLHYAADISPLFSKMQFDGTFYRDKGTGEIIGKAISFEFGCIFEIGRILDEHGICFKNLKK